MLTVMHRAINDGTSAADLVPAMNAALPNRNPTHLLNIISVLGGMLVAALEDTAELEDITPDEMLQRVALAVAESLPTAPDGITYDP